MAIATNAQKETLALAYGNAATWISLHTSDPGTTGAGEVTGGSPAYARKQPVWTGGSTDGQVTASVTFDVPAGTFTYVGVWTAATAGTFLDKATIASTTKSGQDQITVNLTFTQS